MPKCDTMKVSNGTQTVIINSADYAQWDARGFKPTGAFDQKSDHVASETNPAVRDGNVTAGKGDGDPITVNTKETTKQPAKQPAKK